MSTLIYYNSLTSLFIATSIFGLLFLTQFNENKATLRNYRIVKRILTVAYLAVAVGSLPELLVQLSGTTIVGSRDILFSQVINLTVAITQAFIFTHSTMLLLDTKKINSKIVKYQVVALVIYITVAILSYLLLPKKATEAVVLVLTVIYFIALGYFTVRFLRHFRQFRIIMDNFYSDDVTARMHWIKVAFFAALFIGTFALFVTYYCSVVNETIFNLTSLCFYTFFGIRLLNYPWQFEIIEMPMTEKTKYEQSFSAPNTVTGLTSYQDMLHTNSDTSIEQWIAEKHFLKSGITMDDLAKFLGTNRTYISSYFNTEKGITFRQWINILRIEEAKLIITDDSKITMTELASRLGYADTSTFFRQFKAKEGVQPSVWKQKNLSN